MAFTVTGTWGVSGGGLGLSKNVAYSNDEVNTLEVTVNASTTNLEVNCNIDVSQIKIIGMCANGTLTVKTNSTSAPDNTIALVADLPLLWTHNYYFSNPLGADVTKLYLTNAGSSAVVFQLVVLEDPTP